MRDSGPTDGFIIYNEIFSNEPGYRFTIDEMTENINTKHPDISRDKVKKQINSFIRAGLLKQHVRSLSVK